MNLCELHRRPRWLCQQSRMFCSLLAAQTAHMVGLFDVMKRQEDETVGRDGGPVQSSGSEYTARTNCVLIDCGS
jgi:hypothetical protein